MDIAQVQLIDTYNIFDLMGLSTMKPKMKEEMLIDMNMIIWEKFLRERLGMVLTLDQIEEVKKIRTEGKTLQETLNFIKDKVPNFNQLLAEYAREGKILFIRNHYMWMIDESQKYFTQAKDQKIKDKYHTEMELYTKALELLEQYKWDKIITLFAKSVLQ